MKATKYVLYALTALVVFSGTLFAEATQSFGYVNVADAMLLHPTIRHFDPVSKRFKLEALKGVNPEKRLEQNKETFKEDMKKLEDSLDALQKQREKLEEKYFQASSKLVVSEEELKNMSESQKNQYNEKKKTIDSKYYDQADELRKKIYAAKQKIESFKDEAKYADLTSADETNKLFSLMLDDVYDAMGAVAKHYNVSFVFNSSAEIAYIQSKMYADNPMKAFFDNFDQTVQDRDGKLITMGAFSNWLGEKNSTFMNCNDRRLTSFVMMGGLNMTPAVIDYIYQKYNIGKDQRDFIIEYFEKIVSQEEN